MGIKLAVIIGVMLGIVLDRTVTTIKRKQG